MRARLTTTTLLSCSAALIISAATTHGTVAYRYGFDEIVGGAGVVARIRIVEKSPKLYGDGSGRSCGFVYRAELVDDLKGGDGKFVLLFAASDHYFAGFDRDYLVVAQEVGEEARKWNRSLPEGEGRTELLCQRELRYVINDEPQMLVPFATAEEAPQPGEWLKATSPSFVVDARFAHRKVGGDGTSSFLLISWKSVKEAVLEARQEKHPSNRLGK